MQPTGPDAAVSKASLWIGRVLTALLAIFLIFDGVSKLMRAPQVLKSFAQLGFSGNAQIVGIGIVLLACTLLYIIPNTSILGAILLTGYLGGATAVQVRVRNPAFDIGFTVAFGVLLWLGIFLREKRLRELIPLRKRA